MRLKKTTRLFLMHIMLMMSALDALSQDSLLVAVDGDSLWLQTSYAIHIPPYIEVGDSIVLPRSENALPKRSEGLSAKGSISRGIQVSTNASVSLQSSMYLKIDGNLSEKYKVEGTLSERTSPLQPLGNTRRLNDFDRVLISVIGPELSLGVGDLELRFDNGRFGSMDRNIEGIQLQAQRGDIKAEASLGFSYGKQHLMQIQGKDGKQGPYRLVGSNEEKFIIVLAGSEKVLLDNELLIRGEDDDYIIDYNAAEITFTQKHLLSSINRISVEFEYVPDIYLSSYTFGKQLLAADVGINSSQIPAYFRVSYQELRDDQNNPLGNAPEADLAALFAPYDDQTGSIWLSTVQIDTMTGAYVRDSEDNLEFVGLGQGDLTAVFSYVGLEEGRYRKVVENTDSYFVYDEVNGEYLPAQRLVAPGSHAVLAVNSGLQLGPFDVKGELGLSNLTRNSYSDAPSAQQQPAWDINVGMRAGKLQLRLGDKVYSEGYLSHNPLEQIEYYRLWQLPARQSESERFNYGSLTWGKPSGTWFQTEMSQLARRDRIQGQQISLMAHSHPGQAFNFSTQNSLTLLDSSRHQSYVLLAGYAWEKLASNLSFSLEEGSQSAFYPANDHLNLGMGLIYTPNDGHQFGVDVRRRQDYRAEAGGSSFLSSSGITHWQELRQDVGLSYDFKDLMNTDGGLQFKYRMQEADSSRAKKEYLLGQAKFRSAWMDDRLVLTEEVRLDEEHIPRFDYHYVEVDTGYGDFSYDPYIKDYVPVTGGRYIRQRLFSDIEVQVRKVDNKSRLQWSSSHYRKPDHVGGRLVLKYDNSTEDRVSDNTSVQDRRAYAAEFAVHNVAQAFLNGVEYGYRENQSHSALYSFGEEQNRFDQHQVSGILRWNQRQTSKISLELEARFRELEYNPVAEEDWSAVRPSLRHMVSLGKNQKWETSARFSSVTDGHLDRDYSEQLLQLKHEWRVGRRGRLDQELEAARIQADVSSIPYAVFSGRQPGDNWKYAVNGRYTFSSRFQVMLNYSIRQRGENRSEQFLRVEGRTHF